MEKYKPNSHRSKEEERDSGVERKKLDKVVKGTAKVNKKSGVRKLTDVFISEDAANVKSYIFSDVLIPAVKKLMVDIIEDSAHMIFGTGRRDRRSGGSRADRVSYDRVYSDRRDGRYSDSRSITSSRFDYEDIIYETRGDAEAVLREMDDAIADYGMVSVGDMYDASYLTAPYTAEKYGWTSLRNAEIRRVNEGYIIKLPRPSAL